jgi:hypothetical protein
MPNPIPIDSHVSLNDHLGATPNNQLGATPNDHLGTVSSATLGASSHHLTGRVC